MNIFKIAKQLPPKILFKRILNKVFPKKSIAYSVQENRGIQTRFTIHSLINRADFKTDIDQEIISNYLKHEFDLLGSGWVCRNAFNKLEFTKAHQFFFDQTSKLISNTYQFIDWQLEVRSGFSFDVTKQYDQQKIDNTKNVDIKNCWELGRLQHLPQLAIAATQENKREALLLEFKNQSLDFIVSNPIGMGVQWACAMDVGIRVSNLLVAFDIFRSVGDKKLLDTAFVTVFTASIYQHGKFLWNHLEHKEGAAGNHYLFNLVGLLFVTNYLSEDEEIIAWREFAEKEMIVEFQKQFFSDGGNFEGSTAYHCLSAEAVLYGTVLMLKNGKNLSHAYLELLGKSFQFMKEVIKPNGEFPQFGDNDSGRLFKFNQNQHLLNYESLIDGFSALYSGTRGCSFDALFIRQLLRNGELEKVNKEGTSRLPITNTNALLHDLTTTEINFSSEISVEKLTFFSYPEFGIYGFKSADFYLAISAISNKNMHHSWGHVHNDKLSFELQVKGEDLVLDAGTYTYSAFPEKRCLFRASKAHHGIVVEGVEQNKSRGLFYLEREVKCKVLEVKDLSITLQALYYGVEHTRKFTILSDQLMVTDSCNKPFKVNINTFNYHSPNYGILQNK